MMNHRRMMVAFGMTSVVLLQVLRYGKVVSMYGFSSNQFYEVAAAIDLSEILRPGQNTSVTAPYSNNETNVHNNRNNTATLHTTNNTQQQQPSSTRSNVTYFYTKERGDRVGAAIQEMLLGDAFARKHGAVYAGACGLTPETANHSRFLEHFGLAAVLPFVDNCPLRKQKGHRLLQRKEFIQERNISRLFTQEWLDDMRKNVKYPPRLQNFSIAVHIRRGDVSPCHWRWGERYMPNQFYLDLIQLYTPGNHSDGSINVTIFSEKEAYESFDDFAPYNLALDTDPLVVWEALFASDLVIISKSSFSLVPAWLGRGKVVSGPQYHTLLPHWEAAPPHVMERTSAELKRLQDLCPKK